MPRQGCVHCTDQKVAGALHQIGGLDRNWQRFTYIVPGVFALLWSPLAQPLKPARPDRVGTLPRAVVAPARGGGGQIEQFVAPGAAEVSASIARHSLKLPGSRSHTMETPAQFRSRWCVRNAPLAIWLESCRGDPSAGASVLNRLNTFLIGDIRGIALSFMAIAASRMPGLPEIDAHRRNDPRTRRECDIRCDCRWLCRCDCAGRGPWQPRCPRPQDE